MNVVASASARRRHFGLAVFAGNGPTLAIVDGDREGKALGGMPNVLSDELRDE